MTHAPSPLDYALVGVAVLVLVYAGYKAIRHTFSPGERNGEHIKVRVLDEEWP